MVEQLGLELLPFGDLAMNAVWVELVLSPSCSSP